MRNLIFSVLALLFFSCTKQQDLRREKTNGSASASGATTSPAQGNREAATTFRKFTIKQGAHYSDQNTLSHVSGTSMNFVAKVDSTAI